MKEKGYCLFCKNIEDYERVFDVDSNDEFSYCPRCGKKIKTIDAVKAFKFKVRILLKKANYHIRITNKFDRAYEIFGEVLLLDNENCLALCGQVEALMFLSTLRTPRFDDCQVMINICGKNNFRKVKNHAIYFDYLMKYERICRIYLKNIKNLLTHKNFYYDEKCVKLYVDRCLEIKRFYEFILTELDYLKSKGFALSGFEHFIETVDENLKKVEDILDGTFTTVDGLTYHIKSNKNDFKLLDDGIKIDTKLGKYKLYYLDNMDKKHLIKDKVYKLNRRYHYIYKSCFVLTIIFAVMTILCIPFIFVFNDLALLFIFLTTIFAILFFACIGIKHLIRHLLKKRRQSIK